MSPRSRYCKVVHADDWIFPECVERMVGLVEKHPTVAMVGAYRLEETYVSLDGLPYPSTVFPAGRCAGWRFSVSNTSSGRRRLFSSRRT